MLSRSLVLACVSLAAATVQAEGTRGIVAILPFDYRQAQLSDAEKMLLEETVRTAAGEKLAPASFIVLTGESTLAFLEDNAIDPTKVCDANCSLTAARELKATLFVSGSVASADGVHVAFIRMFETARGSVISSEQMSGASVLDIRKKFLERRQAFFDKALTALGVPVSSPAPAPSNPVDIHPAPQSAPPAEVAAPAPQPVEPPPAPPAATPGAPIALNPPPPLVNTLPEAAVAPPKHLKRATALHGTGITGIVVGAAAVVAGGVCWAVSQGQISSAKSMPSANVPGEVSAINALTAGAVVLISAGSIFTITGIGLTAAF